MRGVKREIPANLKNLIDQSGLSYTELCKLSGMPVASISKGARGLGSLTEAREGDLAAVLGVEVEDLYATPNQEALGEAKAGEGGNGQRGEIRFRAGQGETVDLTGEGREKVSTAGLKNWRSFLGLSQEELAKRAKVTVTEVRRAEKRKTTPSEIAESIALALSISTEKLGEKEIKTRFPERRRGEPEPEASEPALTPREAEGGQERETEKGGECISEVLERLMNSRGVKSGKELARRSGVDHSIISRARNGKGNLGPKTREKLAPVLGVETEELARDLLEDRDDDKKPAVASSEVTGETKYNGSQDYARHTPGGGGREMASVSYLSYWRQRCNLGRTRLDILAKIGNGATKRLELSGHCRTKTAEKLAGALDVSLGELADGPSEDQTSQTVPRQEQDLPAGEGEASGEGWTTQQPPAPECEVPENCRPLLARLVEMEEAPGQEIRRSQRQLAGDMELGRDALRARLFCLRDLGKIEIRSSGSYQEPSAVVIVDRVAAEAVATAPAQALEAAGGGDGFGEGEDPEEKEPSAAPRGEKANGGRQRPQLEEHSTTTAETHGGQRSAEETETGVVERREERATIVKVGLDEETLAALDRLGERVERSVQSLSEPGAHKLLSLMDRAVGIAEEVLTRPR